MLADTDATKPESVTPSVQSVLDIEPRMPATLSCFGDDGVQLGVGI